MRALILLPLLLPVAAHAVAVLTMADRPVRLIRGTVLYKAATGTAMQRDDIVETAGAGARVDTGTAIVALGPRTRVRLAALPEGGKPGTEIALLEGWVKLAAREHASVATPLLRVALPAGVTVVHSEGGEAAVFAEAGAQQVAYRHGAAALRLDARHYAALDARKAQPAVGLTPRDFLAALPPAFRGALQATPALSDAGRVMPVKERDVAYADVAHWLCAPPPLCRGFVARFRPRMADPSFRKELDARQGRRAEWRAALGAVAARPPAACCDG